jgi:hypothetical protein
VQNAGLVAFSICWVSLLDYMIFMFTCNWGHSNTHVKWPNRGTCQLFSWFG